MDDVAAGRRAQCPPWIRVVLVALGVPNVVTGAWAVVAPRSWYETFPGWAPRLISAYPPYNQHLATDAGTGLLITGLLVLGAAAWPRRDIVLTASAGFALFGLVHATFHLLVPASHHELSRAAGTVNNLTLLAAAGASSAVYLSTLRSDP
ncbi:MAG: hypothetical protein R2754_02605 [Microthrixaceae bacterium]